MDEKKIDEIIKEHISSHPFITIFVVQSQRFHFVRYGRICLHHNPC